MGVGAGERQELAESIRQKHRKSSQQQRIVLTVLITVGVLASAAFLLWQQLQPADGIAADIIAPQNATEDYGFALTPTTPDESDGATPVPVEVKLYEDFLCPSCKAFLEQSGDYLDEQLAAGTISMTYYPIAFLVTQSTDEYSQRASNAAVCVADQAGVFAYSEMHKLLMQNQPKQGGPGLTNEQLIEFAEQAGAVDITACVTDRKFEPWLEAALKEAKRLDVTATPTIRIGEVNIVRSDNGKESIPGPAELAIAIEAVR